MVMDEYIVQVEALTAEAFRPFGQIIQIPDTEPDRDAASHRYWAGMAHIDLSDDPIDLALSRMLRRPFRLSQMERHRKATQTFVPFGTPAGILAVAPPQPEDPDDRPRHQSIRAFALDGSAGYHLFRGVWHDSLFPIGRYADYLMVVRRDTGIDDHDVRELTLPVRLALP